MKTFERNNISNMCEIQDLFSSQNEKKKTKIKMIVVLISIQIMHEINHKFWVHLFLFF